MTAVNPSFNASLPEAAFPPRDGADPAVPGGAEMSFGDLWQDKESIGFADFLDLINPLQHIPIVSTIYRALTGDEIGPGARFAGGALFGGPLGLVSAGFVAVAEEIGGETLEGQIASLFDGDESGSPAGAQAASETAVPVTGMTAAKPIRVGNGIPDEQDTFTTAKSDEEADPVVSSPETGKERARIAAKIRAAQMAQADLLLATLSVNRGKTAARTGDKTGKSGAAKGFGPSEHPNFLPRGASPQAINQAIGAALDLYRKTSRLAPHAATLPAALGVPR